MTLFGSPLPEFSVQKSLEVPCPASRSRDDLHRIFSYVSTQTDLSQDTLWHFLSTKNRYNFCRYMHYSRVHEEDGETFEISDVENKNSSFYILLRGKGANLISLHPSNNSARNMSLDGMHGSCIGNVFMAKSLRRLTAMIADQCKLNRGICQQFIADHSKQKCTKDLSYLLCCEKVQNNLMMHLGRGSIYLVVSSKECAPFIEKQIDSFLYRKILRRLPLGLQDKNNHKTNFDENVKPKHNGCHYQVRRFTSGTSIFEEGVECNNVMIILRGSCEVRQNISTVHENVTSFLDNHKIKNKVTILDTIFNTDEKSHHGKIPPLCHVGPMSIIGFLPYFSHFDDRLPLQNSDLSERKKVPIFSAQFTSTKEHCKTSDVDEYSVLQPLTITANSEVLAIVVSDAETFEKTLRQTNTSMAQAFTELAYKQRKWLKESFPLMLGKFFGLKMDKEMEEPPFDDLPLTAKDFEQMINSTCKKPKLNKHKILKEFRRLIVGGDDDSEEEVVYSDEGLESGDEWENEEDKFYHDLQPYPSILISRKLHGKTLPIVRRSKGYLCPFHAEKEIGE